MRELQLTDQLAESFDLFDKRVQLTAKQRNAAASRGYEVSQLLTQSSQILECRLVGSLMRSTAIQNFSDVDILAIFDPNEIDSDNSKNLLDLTERIVLPFSYATNRTSIAISMQFSDWPSVDILPAWVVTSDTRQVFRIPAGSGQEWQSYFPDQHEQIVRDGSERLGRRFKSIIRMTKWWNRLNGDFLQSFEIEGLINEVFKSDIPEYAEAFFGIFHRMAHGWTDVGWTAGASADVPTDIKDASFIAQHAYELTVKGHDMQEVLPYYRRLFGERFPSVGR